MAGLYVMTGLSGGGKSAIAKELALRENARIVSSDEIRGEICAGGVSDQSRNAEVFQIYMKRIRSLLMEGKTVIADATNTTLKSRRILLEGVKKIDCEKVAYAVPKRIEQCMEDNQYKEYPVPPEVIEKQRMTYQVPFLEEGFDRIEIHRFRDYCVNADFLEETLSSMKGFDQKNPHHSMNLYDHCMYTAELMKNTEPGAELPYQWFLGACLHDIGKLYSQKFDEEGVAHYYQHASIGAYYLFSHTQDILADGRMTEQEFLDLLFLVNYHMLPMNWEETVENGRWKKRFGEEKYQMLKRFNRCDRAR